MLFYRATTERRQLHLVELHWVRLLELRLICSHFGLCLQGYIWPRRCQQRWHFHIDPPSRRYKPPSRISLQSSRKAAVFFGLVASRRKMSGVNRGISTVAELLSLYDSYMPHPTSRVQRLLDPNTKWRHDKNWEEAVKLLQGTIKSLSQK